MAANVNNYVSAGNAAVRKAVKARQALAENKARLDEIGMQGVTEAARNVANTAKNNSLAAQTAIDAKRYVKETEIDLEADKAVANSKKTARKAGLLGAGVGMLAVGATRLNKKQEPNEMLSQLQEQIGVFSRRAQDARTAYNNADSETYPGANNNTGTQPTDTNKPAADTAPVPQGDVSTTLGGENSIFTQAANITGKYESDSMGGYNAYNLGGSKGGTVAHGSGNSSDGKQFGGALTSMSIGKIKQLQANGQLHAAGRFQFIGNSLPEAAQFAGLSDDDIFSPENQNKMFMAFGKQYGPGRWVGLDKATPEERDIVTQAFNQYQF